MQEDENQIPSFDGKIISEEQWGWETLLQTSKKDTICPKYVLLITRSTGEELLQRLAR